MNSEKNTSFKFFLLSLDRSVYVVHKTFHMFSPVLIENLGNYCSKCESTEPEHANSPWLLHNNRCLWSLYKRPVCIYADASQ